MNQLRQPRLRLLLPAIAAVGAMVVCLAACNGSGKGVEGADDPVLLTIGDSALTQSRVAAAIPPGLQSADSAAMFQSLVFHWIEEMLLQEMADEYPLLTDDIDRRVAEYRRQLVIAEYRKLIAQNEFPEVAEDEVQRYYRDNIGEMKLAGPIVKGIYLKIPSSGDMTSSVRRWMRDASPSAIANIEKYGLPEALQYDNFSRRWVDWDLLRQNIPGLDTAPDEADYETAQGGAVCLLHITECLPAGSEMPYEYAAPSIRERLLYEGRATSGQEVLRDIYRRKLASGHIKIGTYNPGL